MPLSDVEKREIYTEFQIPLANQIRKIEALAVKHASHREIETVAQCTHVTLNGLRKKLELPFNEADVEPSIYGENGEPK